MPRTKSSKKDNRSALEKLSRIDDKLDRLIFFNYYDGYTTEGNIGFQVNENAPPGSTKHRTGIFQVLTKAQFRSKGKKLAVLAQQFIEDNMVPSQDLRPHFDVEAVQAILRQNEDTSTPEEKLGRIKTVEELFIFFQYYDGYVTDGDIGFSPNSGPPGSINHQRAYSRVLSKFSECQFRQKGKYLATLAKEFIANGTTPSETLRPPPLERHVPNGLVAGFLNSEYSDYTFER